MRRRRSCCGQVSAAHQPTMTPYKHLAVRSPETLLLALPRARKDVRVAGGEREEATRRSTCGTTCNQIGASGPCVASREAVVAHMLSPGVWAS